MSTQEATTRRIAPAQGLLRLDFSEIWEFRGLLFFFAWRDIKVRYKQTFLGASWAVLQPFCAMVVFSLFFGKLAKIPSDNLPYPIFSYAAMLPWQYFSQSVALSSNSLVGSADLVRKVYFPKILIPMASVVPGLVDFAIAFVVLMGMMAYYGIAPTGAVVLLPLFLLLACVTALGTGLWLSALNVRYRDVQYVVPFTLQFWMFATPVVYPSSLLAEPWRTLYGLNPMVGVVDGFRWALLGTHPPTGMLLASALVGAGLLISGLVYFRKVERSFVDVI